ncbi:sugar-binding transcriptional regulator [Arenibacterium halophilum]|jgi:DNA-binding transcriptional regulator LsrR (DeoR family)|uniref:Sugar-binding transcriptional regulator n=1 Tax=Arenibacterium halophilum TaxID=2583821 RepID=A0ABY2XDF7_9RHOB|nr:sugar-binding transcriptional regulator [Arenibacterium halophilum]MAY89231.1 Crp/Fnr family transcriptional regulator [Pseudooceanicola sp.]TMV14651.1 sugar-binding transcriptional regulator [Arenibacterium halophilum]|tara:strand:- start:558 stop:1538 length:981 start_codon:yes stop_codon:yes gene_type:complete
MQDPTTDFELSRLIQTVLTLHFIEGMKQSEIADKLNMSHSKVNRLIAQGRKLGMVKISIDTPFPRLAELEADLCGAGALRAAVVTPSVLGNAETTLNQVGRAAAGLLLENLRDGDVIAISGGRAVSAVVENLVAERPMDVTVVPLTGGVQGKFYTDVNRLVSLLAERLSGRAMLLHAPLFAENRQQCDMLKDMAQVRDILDLARGATVALTGVGSVAPSGSSYYDLNPVPKSDREMLVRMGVEAEFLAHLVGRDGTVADYELNRRLVAVNPAELGSCRVVIGVASGPQKARPLQAVLNGGFLHTLVSDEETVTALLGNLKGSKNVA